MSNQTKAGEQEPVEATKPAGELSTDELDEAAGGIIIVSSSPLQNIQKAPTVDGAVLPPRNSLL